MADVTTETAIERQTGGKLMQPGYLAERLSPLPAGLDEIRQDCIIALGRLCGKT